MIRRPYILLTLLLVQATFADDPAPDAGSSVIDTVAHSDVTAQNLLAEEYRTEQKLDRYKKGFLQSASISSGWLGGFGSSELNSSFVELSLGTGIPLGNFQNILGVTPSFRTDYIDAASGVDSPSELHQVGVSFFKQHKFSDRWSAMTIVSPSVRGDFTTSENAFRVFGLAMLTWQAKPERLAVSFGVVYPDRADLPLLPAVGLKWTPNTRTVFDIRFPQSRISWRLAKDGSHSETWSYVSGGFGGSTWAVTRGDGTHDELSLKDIRLLIGVEHLMDGGSRLFLESGLAFNRTLEYEAARFEQSFDSATVIQAGLTY